VADRFIDIIAPDYLDEKRITLALSTETLRPTENQPVLVTVDYADAEPEAVALPLLLSVIQPNGTPLIERVFDRVAPPLLAFVPNEGGLHLVRLAELFHHRWFGALEVDVIGDELEEAT